MIDSWVWPAIGLMDIGAGTPYCGPTPWTPLLRFQIASSAQDGSLCLGYFGFFFCQCRNVVFVYVSAKNSPNFCFIGEQLLNFFNNLCVLNVTGVLSGLVLHHDESGQSDLKAIFALLADSVVRFCSSLCHSKATHREWGLFVNVGKTSRFCRALQELLIVAIRADIVLALHNRLACLPCGFALCQVAESCFFFLRGGYFFSQYLLFFFFFLVFLLFSVAVLVASSASTSALFSRCWSSLTLYSMQPHWPKSLIQLWLGIV